MILACSMYAIYKRGGFGDFAQYVEIFGQPVRIMKYDAYDTKTKQELKTLLTDSGSSLAMMIPKQAEFEMLDGKTSNGDGKLQIGLKDAWKKQRYQISGGDMVLAFTIFDIHSLLRHLLIWLRQALIFMLRYQYFPIIWDINP